MAIEQLAVMPLSDYQAACNAVREKGGSASEEIKSGELAEAITNIPSGEILIEKEITENGVYNAEDDGANGYSKVTVNVKASGENKLAKLAEDKLETITAEDLQGVKELARYAFYSKRNLKEVELPETLEKINENAFYSAGVQGVRIPSNVTEIGNYAFSWCSGLKKIVIDSEKLTKIENNAFDHASYIYELHIKSIESWLNIYFSNDTSIPSVSISAGNNTRIYINNQEIKKVVIPNGITKINRYGLAKWWYLEEVDLGDVTEIGDFAFSADKSLEYISIPDSVSKIGTYAFNYCSGLKNISFGAGIQNIKSYAFRGAESIETVTIRAVTPPTLGISTMFSKNKLTAIYVPQNSVDAYKTATNWANYADYIQAIVE